MFTAITTYCFLKSAPFFSCYRQIIGHFPRSTSFDFHKIKIIAEFSDDVNFSDSGIIISLNDFKTAAAQKRARQIFSPLPDFFLPPSYHINLWQILFLYCALSNFGFNFWYTCDQIPNNPIHPPNRNQKPQKQPKTQS